LKQLGLVVEKGDSVDTILKKITETTILYQINMEDKDIKIKNLEENELLVKNPLLPHTHDYTCKNPSCITHKKNELKDAVFYKDKNSYKPNYICTICFYNW
jgi:aspartate carbamoyltransferase regulatory subunit